MDANCNSKLKQFFENSVNLIRVQIFLVDCEKTALQKTIRHITVITFGYVPFYVPFVV